MSELTLSEILEEPSPSQLLRKVYIKRLDQKPGYSARRFARDLRIGPTLLTLIFSQKRSVSCDQAIHLARQLDLGPRERKAWFEAVLESLPQKAKGRRRLSALISNDSENSRFPGLRVKEPAEAFDEISQWYHVAILDLTEVRGFREDPKWIAAQLDIHVQQAEDAIRRLLKVGLLQRKAGVLVKTHLHIDFPTQRSLPSIRQFHRQMCEKTIEELQRTDTESFRRRRITGMTLTVRSDRLGEAYDRIEKFQAEMADLLTEGNSDSLYHLGIQLIPLTPRVLPGAAENTH